VSLSELTTAALAVGEGCVSDGCVEGEALGVAVGSTVSPALSSFKSFKTEIT